MAAEKNGVLLIAHGSPARDLPRDLLGELRRLHVNPNKSADELERERQLEHEVRHWPRSPGNDPYREGTEALAAELRAALVDVPVIAAYNEFCAPSIEDAVEQMAHDGFSSVDVFSTMMTPGGGHSEHDIPAALSVCRERFPSIELNYRWPYQLRLVAQLIKEHL